MTDIPQWALDRANELHDHNRAYLALARYIAEHETQPEDPPLQQARDIAAEVCLDAGYVKLADAVRDSFDDNPLVVKAALAALKAREPSQ